MKTCIGSAQSLLGAKDTLQRQAGLELLAEWYRPIGKWLFVSTRPKIINKDEGQKITNPESHF